MVCSSLTEAKGENSKLSSFGNALCVVVLEKKGRALLRNVAWLAFTNILNYSDEKKFGRKRFKSIAFGFFTFTFFLFGRICLN